MIQSIERQKDKRHWSEAKEENVQPHDILRKALQQWEDVALKIKVKDNT